MAEASKIQWCDATFNPWRGCTRVSEGCKFCYADAQSKRNPLVLGVWGPNGTRVVAAESQWREPVKWDRLAVEGKLPDGSPNPGGRRPRVFCASLADVFESWPGFMSAADGRILAKPYLGAESGPANWSPEYPDVLASDPQGWRPVTMDDVRRRLFALIDATPNLDWLLVTKRSENVGRMTPLPKGADCDHKRQSCGDVGCTERVRPNVWIGVSVENQAAADERIPHLLDTPAAVRFLSCEPLLGPVDLLNCRYKSTQGKGWSSVALSGTLAGGQRVQMVDWIIVGGESGAGARPCDVEWVRDIVRQCKAAGVPVFVKQLGARPFVPNSAERFGWPESVGWEVRSEDPADPATVRTWFKLPDKKGGEPAEWPADLLVREFPAPVAV